MLNNILVPLDGSTFGEHALPLALALARRAGASLHLVNVQRPVADIYGPAPFSTDDLESRVRQRLRDEAMAYLESVSKRLKKGHSVPVHLRLLDGEIAESLRAEVQRLGADLVVMTTHGRGTLSRLWLGGNADELVRTLSAPVLLVRPGMDLPNLHREYSFNRILASLDGTPASEKILEPVAELCRVTGAGITLFEVMPSPNFGTIMPEAIGLGQRPTELVEQIDRIQTEKRRKTHEYLEGVAARLRPCGLRVQTRVAESDYPADAIIEQATLEADSIIALETRGHRGLSRLLHGSTADKILRGSPIPVFIHRPSEAFATQAANSKPEYAAT